jgi:hypothetical protein
MYIQQPSIVFYPIKNIESTPDKWGLPYQAISLTTSDNVELSAWFVPKPDSDKVVLFFHGNAGNMSHRKESIALFHTLGMNVFIIDYRGYGESEGTPTEQGLYQDAMAAWDYLVNTKGIKQENIIIFGRSLGGTVATWLATQVDAAGLIAESTFSSAKDMAATIYPWLSHALLLRYSFDTEAYISQVHSPVLLIHSPDDEIIPYRLGQKVFEAANQPKRFAAIRGGHNDGFLISRHQYISILQDFIHEQLRWNMTALASN